MNLLVLILSISQISITSFMDYMEPTNIVVRTQHPPLNPQLRYRLFRKIVSIVFRDIVVIKYPDHFLVINQKHKGFPNWAPFTCKVKRNIKPKCHKLKKRQVEKKSKVDQTVMKFMKDMVNKGICMIYRVTDEIKTRRSSILKFIKQQFNILVLEDLLED